MKNFHIPAVLKTYLNYTEGNETPEIFHFWVGVSILAGACERRVWIDTGFFKSALNFYIVLVSPPGICGKNTAFGLGYKLLRASDFTIIRDAITKEKIIVEMEDCRKVFNVPDTAKIFQHSSITLVEEELNVLATTGQEMIKFLTSIFDTLDVYTYKTKGQGQFELINPCLNLGGAAVPSWFSTSVGDDVSNMGFVARCITVYENEPRGSHPIPYMTPQQKALKGKIVSKLDEIGGMFGPLNFNKEASEFFIDWYEKHPLDITEDYRILGYLVRKRRIHIWKLAGLFAVASGRYIIECDDVLGAIEVLDYTERKMRLAFSSMGSNRVAHISNKLITFLVNCNGKATLEEIVRKFYTEPSMTREDFKAAIETIQEMRIARLVYVGNDRYLELLVTDKKLLDRFRG
ncbi:MAG: hypothetical protein KAU20_05840 [Nanoarchaeota archaeon]|nr:hypothetical protein [Nanoarchaeota archaeon]